LAKLTYSNIQFCLLKFNNFYLYSRRCEIKIFVQGFVNKHIVLLKDLLNKNDSYCKIRNWIFLNYSEFCFMVCMHFIYETFILQTKCVSKNVKMYKQFMYFIFYIKKILFCLCCSVLFCLFCYIVLCVSNYVYYNSFFIFYIYQNTLYKYIV